MTFTAGIVTVSGLGLLWLLFAGRRKGAAPAPDGTDGSSAPRRRWAWAVICPVVVTVGTGIFLQAWVIAGSLGVLAGLCVSTWRTGRELQRAADLAESVSSFATVLANQATSATTVIEAVRNAAPLVSGPVRSAALQMGADLHIMGVGAATARFKRRLEIPASEWLADIVDISSTGGGRWMDVAHIFETEAGDEAEMVRYLLRKVGAQLPTVVAVIILSVGIVAGMGWMSAEVGRWLREPQGQMAVAVASGLTALCVGRVLSSVRMMLR